MKRYLRFRLLIKSLFILGVITSCNEYLEEVPDNRVELNSLEKAAQLLTNAYSDAGYNFTEWMSDNVSYTFGTQKVPETEEAYSWDEFTGIFQDTPTFFWNNTYEAIAHANEVLAIVDELPGDDARRKAVKGEALLTRAYGHFMLVNLFAKHYDPETARNDPGVPYVEEPERVFIKKYERNSVRDVYQKIERDLLEGLELVDGSFYANSGKYHFTKNAALAFASRFFLFKAEYGKCVEYSSQLLDENPGIYVKDLPELLAERVNTEDFIRLYTSPADESNLLLMRKLTKFHVNVGHWFTNTPDAVNPVSLFQRFRSNPFNAIDERFENNLLVRGENGLSATKFEFLFERSSLTSNVGLNYTIVIPFRGEEVLLNRAESNIFLNRLDEALADLQLLADKRYYTQTANGNRAIVEVNMEALRQNYGIFDNDRFAAFIYVLEERQKEFIHEGLRWFDIKRYGLPVAHVLEDERTVIELSAEDPRKVLQIPESAIDVGGLEPNER